MSNYKNLVFFALLAGGSLFAETTYLNSSEVKELLNKIESASSTSTQNQDLLQKELNEVQKKINLSNQKKNLEASENNVGLNEESTNKRVKSLQKHYASTSAIEEYIYNDNYSYQSICKGSEKCIPSALVDSEIFNQKIAIMNQKISTDKVAIMEGIEDIYPVSEKLNIVKQIEQTTYSISSNQYTNSYNSQSNNNKRKNYIEVRDGDVYGKVKVSITPNHIKLTKK